MHFFHLGCPQREPRLQYLNGILSLYICRIWLCTRGYIIACVSHYRSPFAFSSISFPPSLPYLSPLFFTRLSSPSLLFPALLSSFELRRAGWQLVLNYETSLGAVTHDPERKGDLREKQRGLLKDVSHARVTDRMHALFDAERPMEGCRR